MEKVTAYSDFMESSSNFILNKTNGKQEDIITQAMTLLLYKTGKNIYYTFIKLEFKHGN